MTRAEGHQLEQVILDRRSFVSSAAAAALTAGMAGDAFARNYGPGTEPVRYPDPDIVVQDPRFKAVVYNTSIQRLHTGMLWAEGPAWNSVGRYLVWSDVPNNEQLRWLEEDDHVGRRFRSPSGNSNGNTFDYEGRLLSCTATNLVRYEHDGKVTVLAEAVDGKRLNSPNDVVVHPDGAIWFTDPGYGNLSDYEANRAAESATSTQPFQKEAIYRIDPKSGEIKRVADQPFKPNGLCFSPDYKTLYVADTGSSHYPEAKKIIWAFDVVEAARLTSPRTFADTGQGNADGLRADQDGNIWAGMGWVGDGYDGVHIFAPDGVRIGQIRLPEICANLCFGGSGRNRLFMTASQSLYALYVETRGAHIA